MIGVIQKVYEFTVLHLGYIVGLNLNDISYSSLELSFLIAKIIGVVVLCRAVILIFGRRKHFNMYSGHLIYRFFQDSFLKKAYFISLTGLLLVGVFMFFVALAGPYVLRANEQITVIRSRERTDFLDLSVSMGWPYDNTGVSLAEFARDYYLKFLDLRKNKNDRVSVWVFSNQAYLIEDFTDDHEFYIVQARDAPYVLADENSPWLPNSRQDPGDRYLDVVVSSNRIRSFRGEGGTDIANAFKAGIKYFSEKGIKDKRGKSILLVTDMASTQYPEAELKQLQEQNIRPYVIYIHNDNYERIDPATVPDVRGLKENAEKLKKTLSNYGGMYFDVNDRFGMEKAFRAIDSLETVELEKVRTTSKIPVFQSFLFVGLIFLFMVIFMGLLSETFGIFP